MAEKTIFAKIIDRAIPAEIVHEDDLCLAFRAINPQAPTHLLVIPKQEIPSVADVTTEDQALMGHIWATIAQIAKELELENGYRVVVNCGDEGGQDVPHLHFHLLGGRQMKWPPG